MFKLVPKGAQGDTDESEQNPREHFGLARFRWDGTLSRAVRGRWDGIFQRDVTPDYGARLQPREVIRLEVE